MLTIDKAPIKDSLPGKMAPPFIPDGNEREIANYPIGKGLKARILVSGSTFVTTDAINKLIDLLKLNKDDLPEVADFDSVNPG